MAKRRSDNDILAQIPAARARERRALKAEPRAISARYDQERDVIIVELNNGVFFGFPSEMGEGLRGATARQLAEVAVSPSGEGLHWESLDADLLVPSLLRGVFGTKAWMKELGRAGGHARSEAKAVAARKNGTKGGRPRKVVAESSAVEVATPRPGLHARTARTAPRQQVSSKAAPAKTTKSSTTGKRTPR